MQGNGHFLELINWRQPWLTALRPAADAVADPSRWRSAINAVAAEKALRNHRGLPIRFVPQEDLPPGMAYEAFISETGGVPTRENLHDFFNALVWLNYPHIKVQLNARQAAEIALAAEAGAATKQRGKVRDAATIFDENAALLVSCDAGLMESLRAHRWQDAFVARRDAFGTACEVRLFGHALMEKLVNPYKAITAHAWIVMVEPTFFELDSLDRQARIDALVARQLADGLQTASFTPLPVLGVPGWWENQDEAYYADATVFRPKRATALNGAPDALSKN